MALAHEISLRWGLHAAKDWFRQQGYELLPNEDSSGPASLFGLKVGIEAVLECRADVVTLATMATNEARSRMLEHDEWKKEQPGQRLLLLFVPMQRTEAAREMLGLYDQYREYAEG